MSQRPILITGFEPFADASLNPSGEVLSQIKSENIVTAILPVVFGEASQQLQELIDLHNPIALIALGQAEGRSEITPERIAINFDEGRIPDNSGTIVSARPIIEGEADGLFSTLPVDEIVAALRAVDIPASVSLSAGTFVCNHIFYSMQAYLAGRNIPSGFIHLPLMDEQAAEFPGKPTLPLATMARAIEVVVSLLHK